MSDPMPCPVCGAKGNEQCSTVRGNDHAARWKAEDAATRPRWVSCAKDVNEHVAKQRHLLRPGSDTTLCGATGTGAGVWRGNSTKPKCATCVSVENPHVPDPISVANAEQSRRLQAMGARNDRADVTSGSGISRHDYEGD